MVDFGGRAGNSTGFIMDASQDRFFFPVSNVRFEDLHDWSQKKDKCQVTVGTVRKPRYQRQKSMTGSLVELNEEKVALFRHDDTVYAINERCPHAGGPLHLGDIEDMPDKSLCVRCPWHSWRFNLRTGMVCQPKGKNLQAVVYPVRVRPDGTILVGFHQFSPSYFHESMDKVH